MAKKSNPTTGRALVIVESPAKARTIAKFLGGGFAVEASIGHVRDLPEGKKQVPEELKKKEWAYLGVNVEENFQPIYIIPPEKQQQVKKLKDALKECSSLYLATDEDREGEAISWHLHELLRPKVPVHRLVFHEITEEAIHAALAQPRAIDEGLVRAQETRRILDRLYGYDVSQLLWKKVGRGLSAGRVQSVAVRLIVDRERERMAFVSASYWDLLGLFATLAGQRFQATLTSLDGRKIPAGSSFDPATGKLKDGNLLLLDEIAARELIQRLKSAEFRVTALEVKPFTERPKPPFTTSTLQQEANRKLGFTARETMRAAQSLYENGHITYMRTDSTTLAKVAVDAARDLVRSQYGERYLYDQPRVYVSSVKNAQEAHEAIRPAGHPFELPEALRAALPSPQFRLFELIWKRTIASQMADARKLRTTITIEGGGATFQVSGTAIEFEGFLRAYVEGSDDPQAELADQETLLPTVEQGELVTCQELDPKGHSTQPPARYSEASLTRKLEEEGIGRPSTYASIIDTIQARDYVFKRGNALVPSWTAFSVIRLLEDHLPSLVDYRFTAQMEDFLDAISRREADHTTYLRQFYFGNGQPGLKQRLKEKELEIDPRQTSRFLLGKTLADESVFVRVGRYGPFLEHGERRASLPDKLAPDELHMEEALKLLEQAQRTEEPLGVCPNTHKPIYLKQGRFGPYVQLGTPDDEEKKYASLMKGMELSDVDLPLALRLLSLPRTLGSHPTSGDPVLACRGRYGPYVQCAAETRTLPEPLSPLDVTLEQALDLLAQPKLRGKGRRAATEPLKTYAASPVTNQAVRLLEGKYGPYVTDGETNASLPRDWVPDELTFEQALQLLADRLAKAGPSKKKKGVAKRAKTKQPASAAAAGTSQAKTPKKKGAPKKAPGKKAVRRKKTGE